MTVMMSRLTDEWNKNNRKQTKRKRKRKVAQSLCPEYTEMMIERNPEEEDKVK